MSYMIHTHDYTTTTTNDNHNNTNNIDSRYNSEQCTVLIARPW